MSVKLAKGALDRLIEKARVHFYKPIQIAEILYYNRVQTQLDLLDKDSYRNPSKKWRDKICLEFLGRTSTSSAKYQDDLFNDNAIPPNILNLLALENRKKDGVVEAYIYRNFIDRYSQMTNGLDYCKHNSRDTFDVAQFISLFWQTPGLRRSIDKVYEIVVYALFSSILSALNVRINVSVDENKLDILNEFEDFTKKVINLSTENTNFSIGAKINRVGVTNAADRGLDMWANFGLAIQVKHLTLNEEMAEDVVSQISADRVVIVCKSIEKKTIASLLNQIGWKSRIQSIITEDELVDWYERALRGVFGDLIGDKLLKEIQSEIIVEFPSSDSKTIQSFLKSRGYDKLKDRAWK